MKNRIKILNRVFLFLLSLNFLDAQQSIRVRAAQWPPQHYRDESGTWTGVDIELSKAIIKEAGYQVEVMELPWGLTGM